MPTKVELRSGLTADEARRLFTYEPDTGVIRYATEVRGGHYKSQIVKLRGDIAGFDSAGYVVMYVRYHRLYAHRIAWLIMTGEWPDHQIDHIDMNRANNSWANLRAATKSQNHANTKRRAKTGFKGVTQSKKCPNTFMAQITHNGKNIYLGAHRTPEDAHAAYCLKARELHGDFARFE